MKKFMFKSAFIIALCLLVYACGKDDDPEPEPGTLPTITSFSPATGPVGTQVTITGTNFGTTAASNVVKFGTVTATVSTASATSLVTTVPVGATTGKISVVTDKKTATSLTDFTLAPAIAAITLDNTTLSLYPYPTYKATLKVTTAIGNNTILWKSSDETLATVSADGVVTPLAIGAVTITATVGTATANCVVTIKDGPVTKLELDNTTLELFKDDVAKLTITTLEAEVAETSPVVWSSDNEAVATVDDQGKITAIALGEAIITATVDNKTATCTVTVNPDVYVAGGEDHGQGNVLPTLWKNGVAKTLSNTYGEARSVFLKGENVYVVGNTKNKATLWVNDDAGISLSDDAVIESVAHSVYVTDAGVVYAVGYEEIESKKVAKIWILGTGAFNLSNGAADAEAYSVSAMPNGESVYIAGYISDPNTLLRTGTLWENDQVAAQFGENSVAYSVSVKDDKAYVAGSKDNNARLWRYQNQNGTVASYSLNINNNNTNFINSVFANEDAIYLAGLDLVNNKAKAVVWKRSDTTTPTVLNTSDFYHEAKSVYVSGEDVYVCGYEFINQQNKYNAKLWKNGELLLDLNSEGITNARALSVFVKE